MILKQVSHYVIELTGPELSMLRDLLKEAGEISLKFGPAWEQLRLDLIYGVTHEDKGDA